MPKQKTKKKKNYSKLAKTVVQKLKKEGIDCYVWHNAKYGSAYIRFQDSRIGSVRIADHQGRQHLGYRWNIRSDFPTGHAKWHKVNGRWRYYVHAGNWVDMVPYIVERKKEVEQWGGTPMEYFIPEFKKDE